jgi:hypothetical protein
MVKTKRVCEWFVRCDAQTNEVIARSLAELQVTEESAAEIIVKVGENSFEKFHAWQVPHAFITELKKSKTAFEFLRFSVYKRVQGRDCAEPWIFGIKKKSQKVVQAQKKLDVLLEKKRLPQ